MATTHSRKVYDTSQVPPAQQFAHWRESICEAFAALDPVKSGEASPTFKSRVEVDQVGTANVSLVQSQVQRVDRGTPQIRRDPRDRLFINLMLSGWSVVEQGPSCSLVRPGEIYVVDTTRPYRLEHPVPFRLLCLDVSRDAVAARGARALALAQARSTSGGRGALAIGLLRQLRNNALNLLPQEREDVLATALRWLRCALEDHRAGPDIPQSAPVHVWQRAMDCIEQRLREPSLGPPEVAADLKVSLSYLHKAFAQRESTVAGTIRELRLQRCADALAGTGRRRKIATIASDWGFNDIPHFNREFKRRFGHTPSAHRL